MNRLLWAGALLLHVALVLRFLPPLLIASGEPPRHGDWPIKFTEAYIVADGGLHSWAYSPAHLAGYPAGVYTGVGTQAYDLWLIATKGMLKPGVAFNVLLLLMFTLPPLLPAVAARLANLSRRVQLTTLLLALIVWHFESHVSYMWQYGTTAFLTSSAIAIIVGVLFGQMAEGGFARQLGRALLAGLLAGIALNFHALGGFVLACLCGGSVLLALIGLRFRAVALMGVAVALAMALNLHWLLPFFHFQKECYAGGAPGPFQTSVKHLFFDLFSDRSYRHHFDTTVLLQAVLLLAAAGLVHGKGLFADRRPWLFALAGLLAISYSGFLKELQPYRFVGALLFAALLPAAVAIEMLRQQPRRAFRAAPMLVVIVFALVLPRLTPAVIGAITQSKLAGQDADDTTFLEWAAANTDTQSRIMFDPEAAILADLMVATLRRETIGGPYEHAVVGMRYAMINLDGSDDRFRWYGKLTDELNEADVVERLNLLNVEWYVVRTGGKWEAFAKRFPGAFAPAAVLGGNTVYRNATCPRSFFLAGGGNLTARTNEIVLTNLKPGKVVLKYHNLSTLTADGLTLRGKPQLGSPVGFIAFDVPVGVNDVTIRNTYQASR